jgi:hypothetical protein
MFRNDLPNFLNYKSVPVLFGDDTSILHVLSHSNPFDFNNNINTVFKILNKFLDLNVDCSLTWINHIDSLTKKKLSTTCYLLQNIKPYLSIYTLKIIHHSLLHSIVSYGIMFWGNSSYSSVIFKMQKREIRIIMEHGYRESCRVLFKEL